MRFLVDLYRQLILFALAIGVIGASFLIFMLFQNSNGIQAAPYVIAAFAGLGIFVLLGIGMTATVISMHDRLAEISDSLRQLANAHGTENSSGPEAAPSKWLDRIADKIAS